LNSPPTPIVQGSGLQIQALLQIRVMPQVAGRLLTTGRLQQIRAEYEFELMESIRPSFCADGELYFFRVSF